jgi:hypothetical protein
MKYPLKELLRKFSSNEIDVMEFQRTLGEWNRFGLWEDLTKQESKLLSKFFCNSLISMQERHYQSIHGGNDSSGICTKNQTLILLF